MKNVNQIILLTIATNISLPAIAESSAVDDLLAEYRDQGATSFQIENGNQLWSRNFTSKNGKNRQCVSCHPDDARIPGRHIRTGKTIEPMSPSVNRDRFADRAKIEKWFLRNCKWTIGRVCTAQEKGDLLTYLRAQ